MKNDYIQEWIESINRNKETQIAIAEKFGCDIEHLERNTSYNKILVDIAYHYTENYAKKGLILNQEEFLKDLRDYICGINTSFASTKEYKRFEESLIDLNYHTRKKDYLSYLTNPSLEMDKMRQDEIKYYDILLSNLELYTYERNLRNDDLDIKFEDILEKQSLSIRSSKKVPYDSGYNIAFTYYDNTCGKTEKVSKSMYDAIIDYLKNTKNKLENMTVEEFREYKILQIRLTAKELERINSEQNKIESYNTEFVTEDEQEIPIENLEFIEEKLPEVSTTSVKDYLIKKMNAKNIELPKEFQLAIMNFLDNVFLFDLSTAKYSQGQKERSNGIVGVLEGIHGSVWAISEEIPMSEVEYFITRESSDIYIMALRCGNLMNIDFVYDMRHPDYGAKINAQRCSYPNGEPRFGINGVEYSAYALDDGRLFATGDTTKIPSLYDEAGNVVKSSKEITSTFKCDSYEELAAITYNALELEKNR